MKIRTSYIVIIIGFSLLVSVAGYFYWLTSNAPYSQATLHATITEDQVRLIKQHIAQAKTKDQLLISLHTIPWIETVQIEQLAHSRISIRLTTRQLLGRFENGMVLMSNGVISKVSELTRFTILPIIHSSLADATVISEHLVRLKSELQPIGLQVEKYKTIIDSVREITFTNGASVIIHDDYFQKSISRFIYVYSKHQQIFSSNKILLFDTRYDYGIAVAPSKGNQIW
ncbi:MAG: hypothetical protein QM538_06885 [Methylacidiphilales bacterium]|nr:hypothetical protein [Candidatus Methylacidiphilales bacterium]